MRCAWHGARVSDRSTRAELGRLAAIFGGAIALLGIGAIVVAIVTRPAPTAVAQVARRAPVVAVAIDAGTDGGNDAAVDAHVVYALDDFVRRPEHVLEGCPDVPLVDRVGDPVPWRPALRVHPSFVSAVTDLESVIRQTARDVEGQDVTAFLCASSYRCTTVRGRPERISEHALGNAIDLRGVVLANGTETSVGAHWHAASDADLVHARFWRTLVERIRDRGIFRGILGPPAPDHLEHLHFDRGPSAFFDLGLDDGTVLPREQEPPRPPAHPHRRPRRARSRRHR